MNNATDLNVRALYHRPYAQWHQKDSVLPRNDIQLRIDSWAFRGPKSVGAECTCSVCRHLERYKPRGPVIPDGNNVLMDQRIQKCAEHFTRRGFRRIGDSIVCKNCRSFCEPFDDRQDMLAKRTQLIFQEIMEWGQYGITFEMVKKRWHDDDVRHRDLANSWYGRQRA